MVYVDIFVLSLPKKNLQAYKKQASLFASVALDLGAIRYREFIQDDLKLDEGKNFIKMVKPKANELIVTAMTEFKSKKQRDSIMKKVMKDERLQKLLDDTPLFNSKKMAYGGFSSIVVKE